MHLVSSYISLLSLHFLFIIFNLMQTLPKTLLKTVFCHTLLPQYLRSRGKKLSNLHLLCITIRLLFSPIIAFNLKGLTVNVRGLKKSIKRRALFRWLHKQNKDFIFLQETYSSDEIANGEGKCCSTTELTTAKVL